MSALSTKPFAGSQCPIARLTADIDHGRSLLLYSSPFARPILALVMLQRPLCCAELDGPRRNWGFPGRTLRGRAVAWLVS